MTSSRARLAGIAAAVLPLALLTQVAPASAADPTTGTTTGTATGTATGTVGTARAGDTGLGRWRVTKVGVESWRVSWTSPRRFPIASDRPTIVGDGLGFGAPTVRRDGRTVSALVRSATAPSVSGLDVLLSGDRLDAVGDDNLAVPESRRGAGAPGSLTEGFAELGVDPGVPGDLAVRTSDYELDPVKLPGMREPIEMIGHVVEPVAGALTGPAPLVLFQHGRHGVCYDPTDPESYGGDAWPCKAPFAEIPSHLGYDYVQRLLASQGFVTVSIRVNGINAQDYRLADGGADARAQIIQRHLDYWTTIAASHQADLDEVVLVGHSRGGEGVDRASIQIPLSAPYHVAGQVLIAPTDFGTQTAPYVPTVTLLPYCDGDVSDLQGQRFTDYSRDLTTGDTSLKSSVLVMGANHNYFNTEWTPGVAVAPANDDWYGDPDKACGIDTPERLTDGEQRDVGATYIAGAVRLFTGEDDLLPLFDGSRVTVPSIGDAEVLSHAIGGGRDVRAPGLDSGLSLASGALTRFCNGVSTFEDSYAACGRGITRQVTPHWTSSYERTPTHRFFEMSWDAAGQSGGQLLTRPLDLSADRLELRTLIDSRVGDVRLDVRLTDADGAAITLTPEGGGLLHALPKGGAKIWGQTLIVDATGATGVDLTRIARVDLISRNDVGRIWVADLSAAPATLAPVPDERLGTISFGSVRQLEGSGGLQTIRMPFTVSGLTEAGRVVVLTTGQGRGTTERFVLDLAPGQTSGSIPITYEADDRDDYRVAITQLSAWPLEGLMTDSYVGTAKVVDDDPRPDITIKAVRKTITEGQTARWRIRFAGGVDYDQYFSATPVKGPRPELTGRDVPAAWLEQQGITTKLSRPLRLLHPYLSAQLQAGQKVAFLEIPTADDDRTEGREAVTVRIQVGSRTFRRTIYVMPSD